MLKIDTSLKLQEHSNQLIFLRELVEKELNNKKFTVPHGKYKGRLAKVQEAYFDGEKIWVTTQVYKINGEIGFLDYWSQSNFDVNFNYLDIKEWKS